MAGGGGEGCLEGGINRSIACFIAPMGQTSRGFSVHFPECNVLEGCQSGCELGVCFFWAMYVLVFGYSLLKKFFEVF